MVYALWHVMVLVVILMLSAQVWAETEGQRRVSGRSYSVPVPHGFVLFKNRRNLQTEQLRAAGGLVLVQRKRPSFENAFLASIVVVPTQLPKDFTLEDQTACAKIAKGTADSVVGTVQTAEIVDLSNGKHCQYNLRAQDNTNRGATGTIFSTSAQSWVVTCNYDIRDVPAISACTQVINGWKFE
ncbi:MAG: hypothetical protein ACE5K9_07120 [Candidatus Methylomirabilales bacterium]